MSEIETSARPGCFKFGCCGCLLLVALLVGGSVLLGGMQFAYERGDSEPVRPEIRRDLPTLPELRDLVARGELGDGERRLDLEPRAFSTFDEMVSAAEASGGVVRLELDLDVGTFRIEKGEPGEGVVIDGVYDERAFRFSEELEDTPEGPVMRITARPKGGFLGMTLRGAGNNPDNRITIRLPPDTAFDLVGEVGLGQADLELGGLLLRRIDLELGTGQHHIDFDEPLLAPAERIRLEKSIGDLRVGGLGNASPAEVSIEQGIGEATVDLRGEWITDSRISVSNRIGELNVEAPDNARVEIEGGGAMIGERSVRPPELDLPADAPVLTVRLSGAIGEVNLHGHD